MTELHKLTHQGHTILVRANTRGVDFLVEGPQFEDSHGNRVFVSSDEAMKAIDEAIKAQHKAERVKLDMPVYNEQGQCGAINGIHAGNGGLTGSNLTDNLYPFVPWVSEALKHLAVLRAETSKLHEQLNRVRISRKRHCYGRPDGNQLDRLTERAKQEWGEATKKAREWQETPAQVREGRE